MKKLLLIPTIIFPYTVCGCLAYGFISRHFNNTVISALGILAVICFFAAVICNVIYILVTCRQAGPKELISAAFLIKAIHIPTYVLIFLLGVIMGLMFFMTFPFIMFLVFIDIVTLWLGNMISIYAIIKALKARNKASIAPLVVTLILQSVFCADVISLFVIYILSRKGRYEPCCTEV